MPNQSGYIALMTTIIISSILLISVTAIGSGAVLHRFNIEASEEKTQSKNLAEACGYQALVNLAYDKNYSGGETVRLPKNENCNIEHIPSPNASLITFITYAEINHHATRMQITVNSPNLKIASWQEVP